MKNKLVILTCLLLTSVLFAGCGSKQEKAELVLKDMDVEQYVTLGEYKGLAVTTPAPAVDEAELEEMVKTIYENGFPVEKGVTDRAVEMGDVANIDYEGKIDGVAFDGGTATGYNLGIGTGTFIDGFEEGLVGVMPGETVSLNLTFPEDYRKVDLAGQAAVFTVTVNYIIPEMTEAGAVSALGIEGVTDVESLRQYAYDYLYAQAEERYYAAAEGEVMTAFLNNVDFEEVPQDLLNLYQIRVRGNIESAAEAYGTDANTYTRYFYGMELDDFMDDYVEEAAEQSLAIQALANAENLNVSDEDLESRLEEEAAALGYATVDDMLAGVTREEYREFYTMRNVLDYLMENAKF